ncbi:hypothetical protein SAMN04488081_0420 [Salimicrobium album]|uniref:Uncharacterized protein n=2 Tax=Salimicrobium TaxID=351195 RepID=A0ABY1KKS2_9BACI|nr:hypothetical protein SAMN04488081_0420 [Salimicrobium album]SIS46413.1 hypothetical protein SAMN05421758_101290 [Salimicrobium salexigens]
MKGGAEVDKLKVINLVSLGVGIIFLVYFFISMFTDVSMSPLFLVIAIPILFTLNAIRDFSEGRKILGTVNVVILLVFLSLVVVELF